MKRKSPTRWRPRRHRDAVSFDADNYKVADTVTVTLEDADLNTAVETIEIYTVVTTTYGVALFNDPAFDMVGEPGYGRLGGVPTGDVLGRVLDITFDDQTWLKGCGIDGDNGLGSTGFTLIETGADTGVFTGDFQDSATLLPQSGSNGAPASTTGVDMEVNYVDYRDASGETIEVGDSAGIRANTGSVSLDRTVYPVPFGSASDFEITTIQNGVTSTTYQTPNTIFAVHASGAFTDTRTGALLPTSYLAGGDLMLHVRINDPDYDVSASGEDVIEHTTDRDSDDTHGPLKISITRGANAVVIATAGGPAANIGGVITSGTDVVPAGTMRTPERLQDGSLLDRLVDVPQTRELGPITEIAPDAGIFELDLPIRYTDGPTSDQCPTTVSFEPLNGEERITNNNKESAQTRFSDGAVNHCILQGDIITVEYTDPTDASGNENTVTDSATFDLRNGVLQSDKSVYIIGQDMILTLIEPDLDLESDETETYSLDLIEWDSDAASLSMGAAGKPRDSVNFDPEPSDLRETGDSTGIFQVVVEIPEELGGRSRRKGRRDHP